MHHWLYVCSAKGIQGFIFASNRLKEIVGGSEIVEALTTTFLNELMANLKLNGAIRVISQAAGNVRLVFEREESAKLLFRMFPLAVELFAPGLQVVQALTPITGSLFEAMADAESDLRRQRNRPSPELPVPGPLAVRSRRDGRGAVDFATTPEGRSEAVSRAQKRKLDMHLTGHYAVLSKVTPDNYNNHARWPLNFEHVVNPDHNYLAVVHMDGNGLGQMVMAMGKHLQSKSLDEEIEMFHAFSTAISASTQAAVREALNQTIQIALKTTPRDSAQPYYFPIRPLVCAGDDITMIMSAEFALDFVSAYLPRLHTESTSQFNQGKLSQVAEAIGAEEGIKACAGIAFIKSHYPFTDAYELSESLCKYAKEKTGRKKSAVAFWRVTTGAVAEFEEILTSELTTDSKTSLTMMPYLAEQASDGCPRLSDLADFAAMLRYRLPRGALRQTLAACYESRDLADQRFKRMLEILNANRKYPGLHDELLTLLAALTGRSPSDTPSIFQQNQTHWATPIYDATTISVFTGEEV